MDKLFRFDIPPETRDRFVYKWIPTTTELEDDYRVALDHEIMNSLQNHVYQRMQEEMEKRMTDEFLDDPVADFEERLNKILVAFEEGHPESRRFYTLLLELGELHDRKQADYGRDSDPFANVRRAHNLGISPSLGVILRMGDKFGRLESFAQKGTLLNESVEDSLRDIAVYALIGLVLLENGE